MERLQKIVESNKFRWQYPVLIDLVRARRIIHGECGGGTGDYNCSPNGLGAFLCSGGTAGA